MISELQRLLYKLSCVAPICVVLAITLYTQKFNMILCILWGGIGIGGCVYAVVFIRLCERKLPLLKIAIDNISQDDSSVLAYFATYLLPLIGVVWKDSLWVWILIAMGGIALGTRIHNLGFCPILLLAGYHCYKANLSTGTACILISRKREVRNSRQIKQAIYISDTLMIEGTGGKRHV